MSKNQNFQSGGLAPNFDPRPPVSIINSVGPMGTHTMAQIVRVMHVQFPRNLNVLKTFSMAHISKTISGVLWPRYFSGSCVRDLCRVRVLLRRHLAILRCMFKKTILANFFNFLRRTIFEGRYLQNAMA